MTVKGQLNIAANSSNSKSVKIPNEIKLKILCIFTARLKISSSLFTASRVKDKSIKGFRFETNSETPNKNFGSVVEMQENA
jgi:hypothetical protein